MTTAWDSIVALYRSDDVTDAHLRMSTIGLTDIRKVMEAAAYRGFDPKRFVSLIVQKYNACTDKEGTIVLQNEEGVELYHYNKGGTMQDDISIISALFAARGSSIKKMREKSSPTAIDLLRHLCDRYGIDDTVRAAGTSISANTVTIPRIVACYPTYLCDIFASGNGRPLYDLADLGVAEGRLPVLRTPYSVCIMPYRVMNEHKGLHFVFFAMHILVDQVIHVRGKATSSAAMLTYYKASYQTVAVPQQAREYKASEYDLIVRGQPANHLMEVVGHCKRLIETARGPDMSLITQTLAAL